MKVEPVPFERTRFWVESESRPELLHLVDLSYQETPRDKPRAVCSCEDSMARGTKVCKHVRAVRLAVYRHYEATKTHSKSL